MSGMTLFHIQLDDGFGVSLLLTLGSRFKTHVFVLIHIWSAKRREAEKYMEKGNFWPVNEERKGGNHLERENEW